MNALPLIVRELRGEARRPWNRWSRVIAGSLVTIAFGLATLSPGAGIVTGDMILDTLKTVILALIWSVVPLLTADCLSRERREGTLGLLFLTPLTAAGIVIGKSLVHGIRAANLAVAAVPVLSTVMLFGGVSGAAFISAVLQFAHALCIALSAGLIASACTRESIRSVVVAVCLTLLLGWIYYRGTDALLRGLSTQTLAPSLGRSVAMLLSVAWPFVWMLYAVWLAARQIKQSWQEGPPSKQMLWLHRTFLSPLFWRERLQASLRRSLDRNPIGWLYERSATARTSKWVWGLAAVLLDCALSSSPMGFPSRLMLMFEMGLLMAMAFAGASTFRRERQNGVMELLLVSPLDVTELIRGRIRSVRKQFLPAIALVVVPFLGLLLWTGSDLDVLGVRSQVLPHGLLLSTSLATLPRLGFQFSLKVPRFLSAWLLTCLVGIVVPYILARTLVSPSRWDASLFGMMAIIQLGLGHFAIKIMRDGQERSAFTLQQS